MLDLNSNWIDSKNTTVDLQLLYRTFNIFVMKMWCNIFASNACQFLKALGSIMVLLVMALIGLTYYTTVLLVYAPMTTEDHPESRAAFIIVIGYHVLVLLLLWSYFACVLTEPGLVPDDWIPPSDCELERDLSEQASLCSEKRKRFCRKCAKWKPDRCHHCSVCCRCVLKMDHHCVWVANCVGVYNYKFFLLFLCYTFLATILDAMFLLSNFVEFFRNLEIESRGYEAKETETLQRGTHFFIVYLISNREHSCFFQVREWLLSLLLLSLMLLLQPVCLDLL